MNNTNVLEFLKDQFLMPRFKPVKKTFMPMLNEFRKEKYTKILSVKKRKNRMKLYRIILRGPNPFRIEDLAKKYITTERNIWDRIYDLIKAGVVVKHKKDFFVKKSELRWIINNLGEGG